MGHTDIHITIDIYTDVFDRLHIESTEKFDRLMEDIYKKHTD
ncbi:MAG: hypothetical protein SOZ68_00480 [Eubacterium pyruvativorans]|nr:hypothetical protein [Eubacterium pyruvativorans]MDY4048815.1 hypothetical protein [Eubacterium pyruvativorans]